MLGTIANVLGDTMNMHFGGADKRTLYITVAGSALRRVELPVAGGAAQAVATIHPPQPRPRPPPHCPA